MVAAVSGGVDFGIAALTEHAGAGQGVHQVVSVYGRFISGISGTVGILTGVGAFIVRFGEVGHDTFGRSHHRLI